MTVQQHPRIGDRSDQLSEKWLGGPRQADTATSVTRPFIPEKSHVTN